MPLCLCCLLLQWCVYEILNIGVLWLRIPTAYILSSNLRRLFVIIRLPQGRVRFHTIYVDTPCVVQSAEWLIDCYLFQLIHLNQSTKSVSCMSLEFSTMRYLLADWAVTVVETDDCVLKTKASKANVVYITLLAYYSPRWWTKPLRWGFLYTFVRWFVLCLVSVLSDGSFL